MTLRSSVDVGFLLIAGRSVLGVTTDIEDSVEVPVEDITPLGQAYDTHGAIKQSIYSMSQQGFYDDASGGANEALALTGDRHLMYAPEGNVIGRNCLVTTGVRTTFKKGMARGAFHRANAEYKTADGFHDGKVAADLVARTAAGPVSTTTVDWGTAYADQTTGRLLAYCQVTALALDSATNLTIKVRHSDDDITYADLATFSAFTSAPDTDKQTVDATATEVERYTQIQHEFTGSPGGSQTATFAVGISRELV